MDGYFERLEARLERIEKLLIENKEAREKSLQEVKLYSVKELSAYSGISEITIRNYIKEGKIVAHKIGRRVLINEQQFEKGLTEIKSLKYKR